MRTTSVKVTGASEGAARREGAAKLGAHPDEVALERVGESQYHVTLKNAPGQVEIAVAQDRMTVTIAVLTPPLGNGRAVTVEDVEKAFADKKIVFGIIQTAIEQAVATAVATRKAQKGIQVAAGDPAVPGSTARVELRLGEGVQGLGRVPVCAARPGQVVAVKVPAVKGKPGKNVLGEIVPAKDGADLSVAAGQNVVASPDGMTFTADFYGLVELAADKVSVRVPVVIGKDEMSARMTICPTLMDGAAPTLSDLLDALKHAGVVHGVKEDLIAEGLKAGKPVQDLEVAGATRPVDGVDAAMAFHFLLNGKNPDSMDTQRKVKGLAESTIVKETVVAGDVLAVKTPAKPPQDGCTVTGKSLHGKKPEDKTVTVGPGVVVADGGLKYVVADGVVGYANLINGTLCVEDPLRVSDDGMSVDLCVQPPSPSGRMLTRDMVLRLLEARGVRHGVDVSAIITALKEAARGTGSAAGTAPLNDAPMARGTPPQPGRDAQINSMFHARKAAGALIEGTDRIDYKERGAVQNVTAGTVLAVKTPAGEGMDGMDVFGKPVAAAPGKDRSLLPSANVELSDDGLKCIAKIAGAVTLVGENRIEIFRKQDIRGDVDYGTGNLHMEGTLAIEGWVRSGFKVQATGDVHVGKGIEDAVVETHANLNVGGGIVGGAAGVIRADGDVCARFIENAQVHAGGDVVAPEGIVRSSVSAGGHVEATGGRGRIMGGSVTALKGVDANELGAEIGLETLVDVGTDPKKRELLAAAEKDLDVTTRNLRKAELALAPLVQKYRDHKLTPQEGQWAAKLAKLRRTLVVNQARQAKYRQELAKSCLENGDEPVVIRVRKAVHEGTTVVVKGFRCCVRETIQEAGVFVLDAERAVVKYVSP